jgi:general secretion pathway protein B
LFNDLATRLSLDMSLILEALKKSEARRQLGEAPGIGTPFTVAAKRRSPLPLIAILILAAVAFGWYYLRTTPSATTPAAGAPGAPLQAVAPPSRAPVAPAPLRKIGPMAAARALRGAAPDRPAPAAQHPAFAQRANPQQAETAAPGTPLPGRNAADLQAARQTLAAQALQARRAQQAAAAEAADRKPASVPTTVAPPAAAAPAPAPAVPPAATPAPAVGKSVAPDLPLYYELPYNVRKDLPDLTISVHVYSAVPAQRFAIIDGEHKVEGDTVHENLTLREIRPDGIVLEFRGQKFLYPRQGR